MEVKEDPRPERRFSVTLSEQQLRMLAGVLEFPVWADQPADVAGFCTTLHERICNALGGSVVTAVDVGMVDGRNSVLDV